MITRMMLMLALLAIAGCGADAEDQGDDLKPSIEYMRSLHGSTDFVPPTD